MLLALALGMTSGFAFSIGGWIAAGALLLGTVTIAAIYAGLVPLVALSAVVAVVLAYNAGVCVGLVPRVIAAGRASAS